MPKKVSISTLNNYLKQNKKDDFLVLSYEIDNAIFQVKVKKRLSLLERSMYVDEVVKGCFVENTYIPEYESVMKKIMFYRIFTDLPVPTEIDGKDDDATQVVNIQKTFDIIESLNLVKTACEMDDELALLFDELCSCVDKQIEYTKRFKLSVEKAELQKLTSRINSLSSWTEDAITNIDMDKLNESINVINKFDPNIISKMNREDEMVSSELPRG